jgi:hypothetical protein
MRPEAFQKSVRRRLLPKILLAGVAASTLLIGNPVGLGDSSPYDPVYRIEEDWQLVLNEPQPLVSAPQFHTVMSPFGSLSGYYALVIWNYRENAEGDVELGGLQIQDWNGESQLGRNSVGTAALSTTAETVTWTQRLSVNSTQYTFEILNGHSETWGNFGEDMRVCRSPGWSDLSSYSTDVSASNSWITYGANRVNHLAITQVRRYKMSGAVVVDSTPRVVYEHHDEGIPNQAPEPPGDDQ